MSTFVKIDRFYVNLDSIALIEDKGEVLVVRLTSPVPGTELLKVKKDTDEGIDLLKALKDRMASSQSED